MNDRPLVTIITVTYNCAASIEATLLSVINQTFSDKEYIIIDGNSTDNTLGVVNKYKNKITSVISEKDAGIYDAMNKGIRMAKGEWVIFMNSGDVFASNSVLQDVFDNKVYPDVGVIYGGVRVLTMGKMFDMVPYPLDSISYQIPFCHQSVFTRTDIIKNNPFDISFKVVADYNMFRQLYFDGIKFLEVPHIISCYSPDGGFSRNRMILKEKEMNRIIGKGKITSKLNILFNTCRVTLINILPEKVVKAIRFKKYRSNPNIKFVD